MDRQYPFVGIDIREEINPTAARMQQILDQGKEPDSDGWYVNSLKWHVDFCGFRFSSKAVFVRNRAWHISSISAVE